MHRIDKRKLLHDRLNRYNKIKYKKKRRKLGEYLNIRGKVLVLAERIKKKIGSREVLQAICTEYCLF